MWCMVREILIEINNNLLVIKLCNEICSIIYGKLNTDCFASFHYQIVSLQEITLKNKGSWMSLAILPSRPVPSTQKQSIFDNNMETFKKRLKDQERRVS